MATRKAAVKPGRAKAAPPVAAAGNSKPAPAAPVLDATGSAIGAKPKQKLIRDSFTIPKNEYAVLDELKQRCLRSGRAVKKSEILRAGISLLKLLSDAALLAALEAVPSLKTGRPKDEKKAAHRRAPK